LFLGETPDTERIDASCEAGVLKQRIPVPEQAEPGEPFGSRMPRLTCGV
jgi:hypothetical protein